MARLDGGRNGACAAACGAAWPAACTTLTRARGACEATEPRPALVVRGHILALHRMDAAAPGTAPVAAEKAKSAALFRASTKLFEDFVASGNTAMMALPGNLPIRGGVPIRAGQTVIGAVGVSGVQSHEDEEVAVNAIAGLAEDGVTA